MANPQPILSPQPYSMADMPFPSPAEVPSESPDQLQLQLDTCNVVEGRVPIENFSPVYQKKIKDYYRFAASKNYVKYTMHPKLIRETLDNV